jgi:hypothetical protein
MAPAGPFALFFWRLGCCRCCCYTDILLSCHHHVVSLAGLSWAIGYGVTALQIAET